MSAIGPEKTELFEIMPIPAAVRKLAVPTVMASLVMILYSLADTYFVSMLNDPVQNAAVTLAASVLLAFNAINNLFGVGTGSKMSRALGEKDYDTVRRAGAFGFWCAAACSLLFSLLVTVFMGPLLNLLGADSATRADTAAYMKWTVQLGAAPAILNVVMSYLVRSEGESLHASIGSMSGCVLNIILDPVFILPWGLNMGAEGAGCATFISNCAACLYFAVFLINRKDRTFVCVSPKWFRPDRALASDILGVGVPASIQNLLNVTGMTILNNMAGAFGSEAVAAMGIAHKMALIPTQVSMGISQGVLPLVGYNYAARNGKRMKESVLYTGKLSAVIMAVSTLAYWIFAENIVRLFMDNALIVKFGTALLRGQSLAQPFLCVDFLAVAIFQACGMGGYSLVFAVLRKIVLEIPALFVLNKLFPMYGLAYAALCAEIILSIAAVFFMIRIFRNVDKPVPASDQANRNE